MKKKPVVAKQDIEATTGSINSKASVAKTSNKATKATDSVKATASGTDFNIKSDKRAGNIRMGGGLSLRDKSFLNDSLTINFRKNVIDNCLLAEEITFQVVFNRLFIDDTLTTETFSIAMSRPLVEDIGAGEYVSIHIAKSSVEDIDVNEVISVQADKALIETVDASDPIGIVFLKSITDSVNISERFFTDDDEDLIFLADDMYMVFYKGVVDVCATSDPVAKAFSKTIVDTVIVTEVFDDGQDPDVIHPSEEFKLTFNKGVVDTAALSEVRSFVIHKTIVETINVTDPYSMSGGGDLAPEIADGASASEVISVSIGKLLTDTSNLSEVRSFAISKNVTETITASEVRSANVGKNIAESTTASEVRSANVGKTVSETSAATEVRSVAVDKNISESSGVTEVTAKQINKNVSETVNLTEDFDPDLTSGAGSDLTSNPSDSSATSEVFAVAPNKGVVETSSITEAISKAIGKVISETASLLEPIAKAFGKIFSESNTVSEVRSVAVGKNVTETVHAALWRPSDLTTMPVEWFDAQDASTINYDAGVTQLIGWTSKGSGAHVAGVISPTNGLDFNFTGINGYPAASNFAGSNNGLMFSDASMPALFKGALGSYLRYHLNPTTIRLNHGAQQWNPSNVFLNQAVPHINGFVWSAGTGTAVVTFYENGNIVSQTTGLTITSAGAIFYVSGGHDGTVVGESIIHPTGTSNVGLLCRVDGVLPYAGTIGEVLIFNYAPDTTEINYIHGYAAHRWGMASVLDSAHPFKSVPPGGEFISKQINKNISETVSLSEVFDDELTSGGLITTDNASISENITAVATADFVVSGYVDPTYYTGTYTL
jgi:hypothetical protein